MPQEIRLSQLDKVVRKALPGITTAAGAEVVKFSNSNFRKQGFQTGSGIVIWTRKTKSKGRYILIKSGRLRRSIRVLRTTKNSVIVGTDVPYAKAHNEGFRGRVNVKAHTRNKYGKKKVGTGVYSTKTKRERKRTVTSVSGSTQVRGHTRTMRIPKNQFLGRSDVLIRNVKRVATAEFIKALKTMK